MYKNSNALGGLDFKVYLKKSPEFFENHAKFQNYLKK